jgi:hypothetical protein
MYGNSIFGDTTLVPDPSRVTRVGSVVPAGESLPVSTQLTRTMPVSTERGTTSVIGTAVTVPAGTIVPIGIRAPVTTLAPRLEPLQVTRDPLMPILPSVPMMLGPRPSTVPGVQKGHAQRLLVPPGFIKQQSRVVSQQEMAAEQKYWKPWLETDGVFRVPARVGPGKAKELLLPPWAMWVIRRYSEKHPTGLPVFGGFGSPDGLFGYR